MLLPDLSERERRLLTDGRVRIFQRDHQTVDGARITTVSYGKEKPIDPGTGDEADAHNRNGHTALVSGAR